jgi:hypothetical protein
MELRHQTQDGPGQCKAVRRGWKEEDLVARHNGDVGRS